MRKPVPTACCFPCLGKTELLRERALNNTKVFMGPLVDKGTVKSSIHISAAVSITARRNGCERGAEA
jgi:hypothetical protein